MFQETVHVDVGEQWACDAALRRAAGVALATTHAPLPVTIPFLDRRFPDVVPVRQPMLKLFQIFPPQEIRHV
jgi:hypothetical protein